MKTGRPIVDPTEADRSVQRHREEPCPSLEGGVSPASPAAYSPRTKLFYTSTTNMCMDYTASPVRHLKGTPFIGVNAPYYSGPGGNLGSFLAWDPARGKPVWELKEPYPAWSGALVTAGDVAFYGTLDGWFKSVDARTGKLLSRFKVGSGVVGNPIAFRGQTANNTSGAVYAGIGGDWFLIAGDVRSDDPADVRAPADVVKTLGRYTSRVEWSGSSVCSDGTQGTLYGTSIPSSCPLHSSLH